MQIYFYCSYEGSRTGFLLTTLEGQELVTKNVNDLPEHIKEFLFVDRFRVLWRELPKVGTSWLTPQVEGAFFGIRNMKGLFKGERKGYVNLCFSADESEIQSLKRIALCVLRNIDSFRTFVLSCMSVGGDCGYMLDGAVFCDWLKKSIACNKMKMIVEKEDPIAEIVPFLQRSDNPMPETELLRLAVMDAGWEDVRDFIGKNALWKRKPINALTVAEFEQLFSNRGTLWEMTTE